MWLTHLVCIPGVAARHKAGHPKPAAVHEAHRPAAVPDSRQPPSEYANPGMWFWCLANTVYASSAASFLTHTQYTSAWPGGASIHWSMHQRASGGPCTRGPQVLHAPEGLRCSMHQRASGVPCTRGPQVFHRLPGNQRVAPPKTPPAAEGLLQTMHRQKPRVPGLARMQGCLQGGLSACPQPTHHEPFGQCTQLLRNVHARALTRARSGCCKVAATHHDPSGRWMLRMKASALSSAATISDGLHQTQAHRPHPSACFVARPLFCMLVPKISQAWRRQPCCGFATDLCRQPNVLVYICGLVAHFARLARTEMDWAPAQSAGILQAQLSHSVCGLKSEDRVVCVHLWSG